MPISPRRVLLPLALGTALSQVGNVTLYTVLPTQTNAAGITLASVGLLFSVNRLVRLFFDGPVGLAVDRWPRRRLILAALVAGVVSTLLPAVVRGFWPLVASRVLWGLAWAIIWIGGSTLILDMTDDDDRGWWTGRYQAFFLAGLMLGTATGGILTDRLGYQGALLACAAIAAVGMVPALWLQETPRGPAALRPATGAGTGSSSTGLRDVWATLRAAGRGLWLVAGLQAVNECITMGVLVSTLALLVQALLPASGLSVGVATASGAAGALRTLLAAGVALATGLASDRLRRRGVTIATARWWVALIMLSIGVVSLILTASAHYAAAVVGLSVGALAGSGLRVLLTALTGDLVEPGARGRALGALNFCGDAGTAIGPVAAYALLPAIGLPGVYWGCAGLYALGLASTGWLLVRWRGTALAPFS